jgi:AcrR family transcriptional regulator
MSAEERRESVLDAAVAEFAKAGLAGTSTETIAARAGISQPYLFRLFSTKKDLFIAAYRRAAARIESRFVEASEGLTGDEALDAMARAYHDLLANRDFLLVQLHTYAASGDADVKEAARSCYGRLWRLVEARSGADGDSLRMFFAMGMLWNVAVALDLPDLDDSWAQAVMSTKSIRSDEYLDPC